MIQITLEGKNREEAEGLFLKTMEKLLPFYPHEIYGYGKAGDREVPPEKKAEIEAARRCLFGYPKLYRFLYCNPKDPECNWDREAAAAIEVKGDKLRRLLIGGPGDMVRGKRRIYLEAIIREVGKIEGNAAGLLDNVFRYKSFSNSAGAKQFLKKLDLEVCPYCNRAFAVTIEGKKKGKKWRGTRPQFDHYFFKERYPYLAVNLYNLIPSCSSCNQYKHMLDTHEKPMLYPYDEGLGTEYVFTSYPKGKDISYFHQSPGSKRTDFMLRIEPAPYRIGKQNRLSLKERKALEERIKTSIKILHLEELYNTHLDYAANILRSGYLFNESYLAMLNQRFEDVEFSQQDVKEILYCKAVDEAKWSRNILAKLVHDMDGETNL